MANERIPIARISCTVQKYKRFSFILTRIFVASLLVLFLVAAILGFSLGRPKTYSYSNIPAADNVTLIIVGFRHGQRNPTQFLKNDRDHSTWAWEGAGQLNNIGKRQSYALGKFLRQRYGDLISNEFFPNEVKAYTSSAERCQQSLQSVMAAFYEPQGRSVWNSNLAWQPVPYEINDPLLRIYIVKCPYYKQIYQSISDDNTPSASDWLHREKDLVEYVAMHSGLNATLSDLADVADNLHNMKLQGIQQPDWVSNPSLPGYPPKDMYQGVLQFAEAHQIMCADDLECSRIMAGLWLNQILDVLQRKSNVLDSSRAYLYAAHTETVLSVIRLLQLENVSELPSSAGFIIEYAELPQPAIRFVFHEADPENADLRLAVIRRFSNCRHQDWCPLDAVMQNVQKRAFSDWREACQLAKCFD